ncbi:MAG TPA: hypothetical protein VNI84_19000 [Pyrinomonadaceae bacterium]|nr:hypothetical protein [Pyrinomonadaceae bacterium]
MNEQIHSAATQSPIIVDTYQLKAVDVDTNPLEVRWAFNPVLRDKILNARECDIARVPFAKFFPIKTFSTPREFHTIDWTQPRETFVQITANEAQTSIEEALAGKGAQNRTDWGLKVGFLGERDTSKMEVISQTLLPTLSSIRAICEEYELKIPLSPVCEGSDELDYGARDTCVACWYKWLQSEALLAYIEEVSGSGMLVLERDPRDGNIKERTVRPSIEEFETARALVVDAFRAGIKTLEATWKNVADEDEKGLRKDISEVEHGFRKDLHRNKPQDRQIAIVQQFAKNAGLGGQNDQISQIALTQEKTVDVLLKLSDRLDRMEKGNSALELTPAQKAALTREKNKQQENNNESA